MSYLYANAICAPQTYVQDIIKENGAELHKLLQDNNGHLFICGDIKMADGVKATVIEVISKEGNMSKEEAEQWMTTMKVWTD